MTTTNHQGKDERSPRHEPYSIRLPGFLTEEIGLGDALKRLTQAAGLPPCGACAQRAVRLNRWMVMRP